MAAATKVVSCCPNCDATDIKRRTGGKALQNQRPNDPEANYWCRGCRSGFDYPAEKEIADSQHSHGSAAVAACLDADVDDVLGGSA